MSPAPEPCATGAKPAGGSGLQTWGSDSDERTKFTTATEGDHPQALQFDVVDTGIGMTAEQVGRIFQEFSQADAQTAREYGGTGLGLVISRRLAQLMGGDIDVVSQAGEGSTFTFWLPIGETDITAHDELSRASA